MARAELQQTAVEPAGSKKICIRGCSRLNKLLHSPAFQMEIVGWVATCCFVSCNGSAVRLKLIQLQVQANQAAAANLCTDGR